MPTVIARDNRAATGLQAACSRVLLCWSHSHSTPGGGKSHMLNTLSRKLVAATVFVAVGLAPGMVAPAYADTAPRSTYSDAEPITRTAEVAASSVEETRVGVSKVLASNDAALAGPAVDADLTPKLEAATRNGDTAVESDVSAVGIGVIIKVKIRCTISWPPLRIRCKITIIIIIIIGSANESHTSVPAVEPAKL
jgi:hypothetical protein